MNQKNEIIPIKRGRGRPKLAKDQKKKHTSVWFSPTIRAMLADESEKTGMSQAKIIERAIFEYVQTKAIQNAI